MTSKSPKFLLYPDFSDICRRLGISCHISVMFMRTQLGYNANRWRRRRRRRNISAKISSETRAN